jgi:hypothetical protein
MDSKKAKGFLSLHLTVPFEVEFLPPSEGVGFFVRLPDAEVHHSTFFPDGKDVFDEEVLCAVRDQAHMAALESALQQVREHMTSGHKDAVPIEIPVAKKGLAQ